MLFVTGRLAEPALRRMLADMAPPFDYDVAVLRITVAALMTTAWIARHLEERDVPAGTDLVLIPGLVRRRATLNRREARRARGERAEGSP